MCSAALTAPYLAYPSKCLQSAYFIVNLALIYLVGFGTERIYRFAFKTLFVWRFLGICLVPYLIVVELFLVKAICLYCTVMHATIIIDFGIISYFLFYKKDLRNYVSIPPQVKVPESETKKIP